MNQIEKVFSISPGREKPALFEIVWKIRYC
jgi:hypothetical protein